MLSTALKASCSRPSSECFNLCVCMQVEVQITCTCSVWGMQTQVESMMIAQAEESMTKFLDWAERQCLQTQQVRSDLQLQQHFIFRNMHSLPCKHMHQHADETKCCVVKAAVAVL